MRGILRTRAPKAADHGKYCLGTAVHEAVETEYKGYSQIIKAAGLEEGNSLPR